MRTQYRLQLKHVDHGIQSTQQMYTRTVCSAHAPVVRQIAWWVGYWWEITRWQSDFWPVGGAIAWPKYAPFSPGGRVVAGVNKLKSVDERSATNKQQSKGPFTPCSYFIWTELNWTGLTMDSSTVQGPLSSSVQFRWDEMRWDDWCERSSTQQSHSIHTDHRISLSSVTKRMGTALQHTRRHKNETIDF